MRDGIKLVVGFLFLVFLCLFLFSLSVPVPSRADGPTVDWSQPTAGAYPVRLTRASCTRSGWCSAPVCVTRPTHGWSVCGTIYGRNLVAGEQVWVRISKIRFTYVLRLVR